MSTESWRKKATNLSKRPIKKLHFVLQTFSESIRDVFNYAMVGGALQDITELQGVPKKHEDYYHVLATQL